MKKPAEPICSRRQWLTGTFGLAVAELASACRPLKPTPTPTPRSPMPEMVHVPAGSFLMGDDTGIEDARPLHEVRITHDLLVGRYPVTFDAFDAYCLAAAKGRPDDKGWGRGDRPAIYVDWNLAVAYCNWLSDRQGLTRCYSGAGKVTRCDWSASGYRLPTEAEWEYIARGGPNACQHQWAGSDDPTEVAWFTENAGDSTQPVGQLAPNALGVYDMCGNVWEWCWDKYRKDYYAHSPTDDPRGPDQGRENIYQGGWERVRRGGSYDQQAEACTVSYRSFDGQSYKAWASGFRVVRVALP